ncbi:MAG: ATPase domain-containing protein [Acidobacteriaceae bacterium]
MPSAFTFWEIEAKVYKTDQNRRRQSRILLTIVPSSGTPVCANTAAFNDIALETCRPSIHGPVSTAEGEPVRGHPEQKREGFTVDSGFKPRTFPTQSGNGTSIQSNVRTTPVERFATGIAGLDDILGGGLARNHLYLVEGDPGTGKTTIAMQFLMEGVRRGQKGLYVTLSESKAELLEIADSHGWSLDGVEIFELVPDEAQLKPEAQYTVFNPSEIEMSDTTNAVMAEVERLQPARVVFDSLSELRLLARDSLRYRRQILGLKQYFSGRNCTVLLLDDRTGEGHDQQLQSIAHGVILMESAEREYGIKRRRLEVKKLRGSKFREGLHDYCIKRGGVEVYPRLVAAEHLVTFQPTQLESSITALDTLLGGGIDSGTSTLLLGPAGCGKSTIAIRYAVSAVERGERPALFTFDETLATLVIRAKGLGMDIKKHADSGNLLLRQVDAAELSPGQFVYEIRQLVEKQALKLLIIDSLNGFLNAMPGEHFLAMQLHELLAFLSQKGVTTIMTVSQVGFVGTNIDTPVDVSYLADTVLLFRYFEAAGEVRQALSVIKKRSGEHERTIRELVMRNGVIAVGEVLTEFDGVLTGSPTFRGRMESLQRSSARTDSQRSP